MIKLFALLTLSFFGYEALSDPINRNRRYKMTRQEELVNQTTNRGQTVEQERRGNARAELFIENAIQEFNYNHPD